MISIDLAFVNVSDAPVFLHKLVECNDEIASPVRAVLRGRPSSRRAIVGARRGGHGGPPVQAVHYSLAKSLLQVTSPQKNYINNPFRLNGPRGQGRSRPWMI